MQTLLLADDSVTIQRVIELTFADEDIRVVAVSDGDAAITRLDQAPPDIVLADVGMPGKNGYEVAGYVKASPRLAHIPVMLLTGAFEPIDQERAKRAGCDGVLAKPFEPQFVITRVKELLARAKNTPARVDMPAAPAGRATPEWSAPIPVGPDVEVDLPVEAHAEGGLATRVAATQPAALARDAEAYFDRLDAALTDLSAQPRQTPPRRDLAAAEEEWDLLAPPAHRVVPATPVPATPVPAAPAPAVVRSPAAERPATPAPPARPAPGPEPPLARAPEPAPTAPTVAVPAAPQSLSDAFAILLAAEQHQAAPASAPAWPGPVQAAPVDIDALADRVARRVLEQLSDRAVREQVSDIVSTIAERLVREEIDRIKASLK